MFACHHVLGAWSVFREVKREQEGRKKEGGRRREEGGRKKEGGRRREEEGMRKKE